jgi:hypothetical protein
MTTQTYSTDSVELEIARESLRKEVTLMEAVMQLRENEQFKLVIAEGFLTNVVNNEVSGLISQNEIIRASALDKIKAAQYLKAYLDYVTDCGLAAKMELLEGVE